MLPTLDGGSSMRTRHLSPRSFLIFAIFIFQFVFVSKSYLIAEP
jgi:hypothetical protein